eukprot:3760489-Pleurochrysis_carterae.AAC.1
MLFQCPVYARACEDAGMVVKALIRRLRSTVRTALDDGGCCGALFRQAVRRCEAASQFASTRR